MAACGGCRTRKSRCDGVRPSCARCVDKKLICVYDVENGEIRLTSLKQRHPVFVEKHQKMLDLLVTLRTAPMEVVNSVIEGIRAGEDAPPYITPAVPQTSHQPPGLDVPPVTTPALIYSSSDYSVLTHGSNDSDSGPSLDINIAGRSSFTMPSKNATLIKPQDQALGSDPESPNCHPASPLIFSTMPPEHVVKIALEAYNNSVGSLFHIYTPDQVSNLFDAVYNSSSIAPDRSTVCQLCAVAALGAFYSQDRVTLDDAERFYNVAKLFLDDLIESRSIQAIKVCALLGCVNIQTKSSVTLVFFDMGLSMACARGLDNPTPPARHLLRRLVRSQAGVEDPCIVYELDG